MGDFDKIVAILIKECWPQSEYFDKTSILEVLQSSPCALPLPQVKILTGVFNKWSSSD